MSRPILERVSTPCPRRFKGFPTILKKLNPASASSTSRSLTFRTPCKASTPKSPPAAVLRRQREAAQVPQESLLSPPSAAPFHLHQPAVPRQPQPLPPTRFIQTVIAT